MPRSRQSPRVFVALATLALIATAGCASRGSQRPSRPVPADSASIANVDGKSWEDVFAGRFPGVIATRTGNGALQIRIRGGSNSFYASEEPLYVLDGTPLPDGSRGILMLTPTDIERIEVLKNPNETAIYGIRGSNGVVKITTKRPGRP